MRTSARIPLFHFRTLVLALLMVVWTAAPTLAQATAALSGVVADGAGLALPGARVTVTDGQGKVAHVLTTDAAGAFAVRTLPPGAYVVLIELNLFMPVTERVTVAASPAPPLRLVLTPGGFAEHVVVTARRAETRLAETPQRIEVIDAVDLERTVAADLTDVLKKASGVDVIQYSGALSGIGIRGFRPQFSGINKRSLLLIDGRASGVTNLATLRLDHVDRIEVLKGAASALYGSSAMGGVVNVITRRSRGKIAGDVRLGGGSFGTSDVSARMGGNASSRVDFDLSGNLFDQRDSIRMGNGAVRPATSYQTHDGTVRLGVDLGQGWRVDGRANGYRGRDILTPGELASGVNAQGSKDLERSTQDVVLSGRLASHEVSITAFSANEASHTTNVTSGNPADAPFLPYLSFESDLQWSGVQLKDAWRWSRLGDLVVGVDYEKVSSVSRSFARTGAETAPFSANSHKRTVGAYAEQTLKFRAARTVMTLGGRLDRLTNETVETRLKTNFTPSAATFHVFNPSIGLKHQLRPGLRAHITAGRAFIPAEAFQLTGSTVSTIGGRTQINQGNADLRPERSTSFDVGAEWSAATTRVDVTVFRTKVRDRFISNVTISNPPAPAPIVVSVENGLDAHLSGLELELAQRIGSRVGVFANTTHYFQRKERLTSGAEQDILNVARNTIRAGIDLDFGRVAARVSGRYVQGRKDNDFNLPGFPIIENENFTVVDAMVTYRLARRHAMVASINNLFDAYYYEKLGFPLQGASFALSYRLGF